MPKPPASPLSPKTQVLGLVAWFVVTFAAAWLGNAATMSNVRDWYPTIAKPAWTPPSWVFGPVWTALYTMMALAAWLVWRRAGFSAARYPLALYLVQLALNALWSVLFFGLKQPLWGAIEIVFLWFAIAATLNAFWQRTPAAGLLMTPYLAWVTFAAGLNFELARLNG